MLVGWVALRALHCVTAPQASTRAAPRRGLAAVEVIALLALLCGLGALVAPLMSVGVLQSVGCVTQKLARMVGGELGESGACGSGRGRSAAVLDGNRLGTLRVVQAGAGVDVLAGNSGEDRIERARVWVRDLSADDIARLWPTHKNAFLDIASQPNELAGRQLFSIWLRSLQDELDHERRIQQQLTARLCHGAPAADCPRWRDYWTLVWQQRLDELEPEYRHNARRLAELRWLLAGIGHVRGTLLENGNGSTWLRREEPRRYTLDELDQLADEGARRRQLRDQLGGAYPGRLANVPSLPRGRLGIAATSPKGARTSAPPRHLRTVTAQDLTRGGRTLLLGEGDFSFTRALVRALGHGRGIVSTSYDSASQVVSKYPGQTSQGVRPATAHISEATRSGVIVEHGVDATRIRATLSDKGPFNTIVFNFPYVPEATRGGTTNTVGMLDSFFANAGQVLAPGGRIYLTLASDHYVRRLRPVDRAAGWRLVEEQRFDAGQFPGYRHQRTVGHGSAESTRGGGGRTFVFEKE
jgi:25S rRNA (uracil2634-N3)-methyltransferase